MILLLAVLLMLDNTWDIVWLLFIIKVCQIASCVWSHRVGPPQAIKLHVQAHYDLARHLMRATHYYLLLAEYGRCSKLSHRNEWCSPQRNAWDKCSTDIFYVTILSKLTQQFLSYTTRVFSWVIEHEISNPSSVCYHWATMSLSRTLWLDTLSHRRYSSLPHPWQVWQVSHIKPSK